MTSRRRKAIAGSISFMLYMGIFLLSSLPGSALPKGIPDIIPHAGEYAILAFFFIQVFNDPARLKTTAIAILVLALLAVLDETHQAFVPGRVCSALDVLFDMLGSACGLLAYLGLRRCYAKKRAGI